jgi:hypothetical protein
MEEITNPYDEKIIMWKKTHGSVYEIKLSDDNNGFVYGYIRKPTRNELRPILSIMQNDMIKASEILLQSVWLGGDELIKTNDDYFLGAMQVLGELIEFKAAELKKL